MELSGLETVYCEEGFEVLRAGRDRFFLKVTGGLRYAAPGLTELSWKEAETLIQEHILKELRRGQREAELGNEVDVEAGIAAIEKAEDEKQSGDHLKGALGNRESTENPSSMGSERRWI